MGCHALSPGDLPDPGIESGSPTLQVDSSPYEPPERLKQRKKICIYFRVNKIVNIVCRSRESFSYEKQKEKRVIEILCFATLIKSWV